MFIGGRVRPRAAVAERYFPAGGGPESGMKHFAGARRQDTQDARTIGRTRVPATSRITPDDPGEWRWPRPPVPRRVARETARSIDQNPPPVDASGLAQECVHHRSGFCAGCVDPDPRPATGESGGRNGRGRITPQCGNQRHARCVQPGMDPEDRAVWATAGHDPDDPDVIEWWHWVRWQLEMLRE